VGLFDPALAARLRQAAGIIADEARARTALWSETIPGSIRIIGGTSSVTVAAGGVRAPSAYTWEGKPSGAPRNHPVFGRGDRPRSDWTWVPQLPVRPFLREAVDAKAEEAFTRFARVIDDWAHEKGFK
jgi:hypothetical protein